MHPSRLCTLLLLLISGAALAQDDMMVEKAIAEPVTRSLEGIHKMTSGTIVQTAEMLDDAMYAYRPTEDVRTAGQMLAHIANAQYFFCSTAAGEPSPNEVNIEETATTKDEIVSSLKEAFAYCDGVYAAMTDAQGAEARSMFGNDLTTSGVLAFNTTHNYEHYGNLVTYMRMNGIVPPSSQQ
ncbi:MAG: DinB family protein [Rhodothermales bacterium]